MAYQISTPFPYAFFKRDLRQPQKAEIKKLKSEILEHRRPSNKVPPCTEPEQDLTNSVCHILHHVKKNDISISFFMCAQEITPTTIAQRPDLLLLTVRSLPVTSSELQPICIEYHILKSLAVPCARIKYFMFLKEDLSLYHFGDDEHEALI